MLVREYGDSITDEELTGLADGVLTGGLETTASMLALGTLILLQNPEHFTALRDAEDPEAVAAPFVDELLRHLTVVQTAFPRFAREDVEIGGVQISGGDIVLVSLSAADRDARLGEDMDRFDPSRQVTGSHLAFGYGIHRCIGAELGKMELRAAFPQLVRRFPELKPRRRAPGPGVPQAVDRVRGGHAAGLRGLRRGPAPARHCASDADRTAASRSEVSAPRALPGASPPG